MGKYAERIDTELQNEIYAYIENPVKNNNNDIALQSILTERQCKLNDFKMKHMSKSNRVTRKTKEVTYDMLPELMAIADLSLRDVFSLVNIKIEWPSADAQEMCELCDRLNDEQRLLVKELAVGSAPSFWHEPEALKSQPTRRAFILLERMFYRPERRREEDGLITPALNRAWSDQKLGTSLKTIDFPQISKNFQVSLHWLLKMDKNTKALAKYAETEEIMTAYLFLAPEVQIPLKNAVKKIV